jgi:uncharacterized sulfatase
MKQLQAEKIITKDYEVVKHMDTLPRMLKKIGYASFEGGKYWEGTFDMAGFTEGMADKISNEPLKNVGTELGRQTMKPLYSFIDKYAKEPFFIWFAPMLPHVPFDPEEKYLKLYEGKGLSKMATKYYANCTKFDDRVGELVSYLEKKGLREKTLLIYISDNGWEQDPNTDYKDVEFFIGGSKGKNSMHELGFRSPFIFNWPGRVKAGQVIDDFV